jgi:hypothetical protein
MRKLTALFTASKTTVLAACLASAIATTGLAQTADQEQWYQVELVVFANTNELAASNEIWQTPQGLNYPSDSLYLQSPETIEADGLLPQAEQPSNDFSFNNNNTFSAEPEPQFLQSTVPADTTEHPYTLLDDDQLTLKNAVRRLRAQRDFRPLFHAAWRQPIDSRSEAKSIIINAGERFDDHYELEGTIKLGLERYLHVETDLWLSSFVSNIGLSETRWPVLPKRPNNPKNASTNEWGSQPPASTERSLLQLLGNQFSVERTLVLQQQRRMRSDELHYIDHPLMGVLIRVTTYEKPEPEKELTPDTASLPTETLSTDAN